MSRKKQMGAMPPSAKPAAASPMANDNDGDEFEARQHLKTLMDAEDIKGDPAKMKRVHALAGRHVKALKKIRSVQDLKDEYNNKFGSGAQAPDAGEME